MIRNTNCLLLGLVLTAAVFAIATNPSRASAEETAIAADKPTAGYDGGFFIRTNDENFEIKAGVRIQERFTFLSEQTEDDDGDKNRDEKYNFSIPRARLKLGGNAFGKNLTYMFQADFGKGMTMLRDAYVDAALVPKVFQIRAGQFKRPFSRQQITSSGNLELVYRAITDEYFGAGRDIGIAFHNNYDKSPAFEYAVGLFNGTGDKPWFKSKTTVTAPPDGSPDGTQPTADVDKKSVFVNVPDKFNPALVARIGYNYGDLKGYSEADLEGGGVRFGIGAGGQLDFDADEGNDSSTRANADYIVKLRGFSSTGGIYVSTASTKNFSDQEYAAIGGHVQAGYVIANLVQPAARYAIVNPDGNDNNRQEILGGLSFYFFKHNLKWQTDGGAVLFEDQSLKNYLVETQLQLAF